MKKFPFPGIQQTTSAVLGLLFAFLLPLAVILVFFLSEINGRIAFSRQETAGLTYDQGASRVLEALIRQRLLMAYNLAENTTLQDPVLETELQHSVQALSSVNLQLGQQLRSTVAWEGFNSVWQNTQNQSEGSLLLRYTAQNVLVQELTGLISRVGDTSNLILDPELDSYYLMNGLINVLPALAHQRAEVVERAMQVTASKHILSSEESHLNARLQLVDDSYIHLWRSLDNALLARPQLGDALRILIQQNQKIQVLLQEKVQDNLLSKSDFNLRSQELYQMEKTALDAQFQLEHHMALQLQHLLDQRVQHLEHRRNLVLLLALIMVVFSGVGVRVVLGTLRRRQGLEANARLISSVFSTSGEAFFIADRKQGITGVNAAFQQITGYEGADVQGQPVLMLAQRAYENEVYQQLMQELMATGRWKGEVFFRRKNGHVYPVLLSVTVLTDHRGAMIGFVGSFSDITEKKEFEQSLLHLVHHDVLTGLPNRALFEDRTSQALALQQHRGGMLSVLFLNLDHFKQINESFGHATGDLILCEVAARLKQTLGQDATVARQGGDEFMLLLPEVPSWDHAGEMAQKILDVLASPYRVEDYEFALLGSIGISMFPRDGDDVKTLLKNADTAVSRAKAQGRNTFGFYTAEMNQVSLEKLRLEHDLRQAVARNELVLFYQPQVNVSTGQVVGVEALLRWQHPQLGMVSPAKFIPLAEETGLIVPIGAWVLREACAQSQKWQAWGFPPLKMSVNLSALQFKKQNVVQLVQSVLQETGLPAHLLDLEFTESLVMENTEYIIQVLQSLRDLGVQLSVDDFGTGYSSLSYLKRFPVNTVKIDRSFVQSVHHVREDAVLTRAIIALARSMNLKTVAEGVETIEQLNFLMQHNCDEVQGFYFSKPLPVFELEQLMHRQTHFEIASFEPLPQTASD
ncbi:putative bifunctional diguanylate cyclase/phosphodiesterase [Deinococcus roseus]|uniref:Diguanylate cyclase n=1 Tax=Deinococcus roseus TaxID=392414 RepID=A0ABQ2CZR0_9DEIO|nr:EAL domain-containing protein [Deinococcus roseus]GGJ29795.1 hypothetical protein GCM10008938_14800 [Deinococcus roseus]